MLCGIRGAVGPGGRSLSIRGPGGAAPIVGRHRRAFGVSGYSLSRPFCIADTSSGVAPITL
ncbi:hypothetical protein BZB76_6695 [Actinomadura pelletieri DSM 43383]|uniref:Uncharacterized protein n=1 Tax=Actinomadura pelletieri DSM 43383 TaxID=1120940 RepID=A0A495QA92_9ACTN|nr:hypothetical protein BZB76_6695 [Actinomadura pelletieri DSM 43383]